MAQNQQNQAQANQSNLPAANNERGEIIYQVAGQDVKLSFQIVRNFLTRGNGQVTDQDIVQFTSICKYNQLNPFLNEAYLVKFGDKPAQMIVSKEALMKRAEECSTYEGIQAGVIVMRDNQPVELEGSFYLPTDKLVGGWAKVYRSDRKFPVVSKVRLEEYDKKQSTWTEKQSTMIAKVAKVQALREAFPTQLGAMYTAEEQGVVESTYIDISDKVEGEKAEKANKKTISISEEKSHLEQPEQAEHKSPETNGDPQPNVLFEKQGQQQRAF